MAGTSSERPSTPSLKAVNKPLSKLPLAGTGMGRDPRQDEIGFLSAPGCPVRRISNVSHVRFVSSRPVLLKHPSHSTRVSSSKSEIVMVTSSRGFGGFLSNSSPNSSFRDPLPSPDAICACGSEKPYGKCCRRFHTAQNLPQYAEELLRSRYSAYAYRLPSYIMKTTHASLAELDRRKWKREILEFCNEYQFVGGVDIVEQQMTGPYSARILFRYASESVLSGRRERFYRR